MANAWQCNELGQNSNHFYGLSFKKLFYIKTFNVCLACIGYKYFCSPSNIITLLSFLQVLRYTQNIYLSKAKCFVLLVEYKYSFFELYFKKPNELWSHFPLLSPKSSWMSRIPKEEPKLWNSWCVPLSAMKTEEMWNILFSTNSIG